MKIPPLSLALILMTRTVVSAQTTDLPVSNIPAQPAPSPSRDIMPLRLNHKANPVQPPAELAAPIDRFFKALKTGDYAGAYEGFLMGTRLGAQKEKMSVFISKTQDAFGLYGALTDYEIYDNYSIGSNVLVLTYLSRHSIQPLRWRFVYYRAEKTWGVVNMGFDDVLLDMLD